MSHTIEMGNIVVADDETKGSGFWASIWDSFLFAMEMRALVRIQNEAGHMITAEQIDTMRRETLKRHNR